MKKNNVYWLGILFILCFGFYAPAQAQIVNRRAIEGFLQEGEVGRAQKTLESYLGSTDLAYQDSIYILKNLGVLYSSSPKRKALGDRYFSRLLDLDPFASIHDTYASNTILLRFKKIRKTYQAQKGGKALVPAVAVFDFHGTEISPSDGAAMAQQFVAEMQRLDVFHTLERNSVAETMEKMRIKPDACLTQECRMDIARRLTADKMVTLEVAKLDTVYNLTLKYTDLETGEITTTITKAYTKSPQKLLAEGFGELATALQEKEAAWLNLSLSPTNTLLTIDGTPMAAIASRFPLNPGKHTLCGSSPGYNNVCKTFEVKRADALTYSLVLPAKAGTVNTTKAKAEDESEDADNPQSSQPEAAGSHRFIWWTVGAMAAVGLTLAIVFNAK